MKTIDNFEMGMINSRRQEKNYTVRGFCEIVGITTPTYYNYLKNKTEVPADVLSKMKTVLSINTPVIAENNALFRKNLLTPEIKVVRSVV